MCDFSKSRYIPHLETYLPKMVMKIKINKDLYLAYLSYQSMYKIYQFR